MRGTHNKTLTVTPIPTVININFLYVGLKTLEAAGVKFIYY